MSLLDQLPEMDSRRESEAHRDLATDAEARRTIRRQREEAKKRARHVESEFVRFDNLTRFLLTEYRRLRADVDEIQQQRKGRAA